MTRIHQAILVAALAVVGVWGCSRPATPVADAKLKQLETRVAKLEGDLADTSAARDGFRTRLATAEATTAELRARLTAAETRAAVAERDRDRVQAALKAKAAEREQVQAQFDGFRKNIKELLGQADTTGAAAVSVGN